MEAPVSAGAGSAPAAGSTPASTPAAGSTPGQKPGTTPPAGSAPDAGKPGAGANNVPGSKPGETAAQTVKRMLKAKIDGQDVEVDEEEAIRAFQKSKGAEKRFQEAATMRKQAEQIIGLLKQSKSNPRVLAELLKHPAIGGNFDEIAERYLLERIQRETMDPKDRELMDTKARLQEIEQEREQEAQRQRDTEMQTLVQQYTTDIQKDITGTLDTAGLPKSEYTISRMARYMNMALQRGVELKATDVVDLVRQDYLKEVGFFAGGLPIEQLFDVLGPDVAKRIREYDISRVRGGANGGGNNPPTLPPPAPENGKREQLTRDEFRQRIAQKTGVQL
jgi:hypothetical protein